jgi:RNA polymerase sigma factor (sigma-70 family)
MNILDGLPAVGKMKRAEENRLARRLKKNPKDQAAANALVMANMQEAILYSKKVSRGAIEDGALMSLCYESLMRSTRWFRSNRKTRFFAYAKQNLRGNLAHYWSKMDTVNNASLHRKKNFPERYEEETTTISLDYSKDNEKCWSGEAITCMLTHDQPPQDNNTLVGHEQIIEPDFEALDREERWQIIKQIMRHCLNVLERQVLSLAYESDFTLQEIGKKCGFSRSWAQQMHAIAVRKIQAYLATEKVDC